MWRSGAFSRSASARLLLGGCVLAFVQVPTADAQFGALGRAVQRKAEQRVEQSAEDRANVAMLTDPTFDATTVEITADRLERYLAALAARSREAGARRQSAEEFELRLTALGDSARAADERGKRTDFEKTVDRYSTCRRAVRDSAEQVARKNEAALEARIRANPSAMATDPTMKRLQAIGMQLGEAQQRGDAAAVERFSAELQAVYGGPGDSASLDRLAARRCGMRPARNADLAKADAYRAREDSLRKEGGPSRRIPLLGAPMGLTDAQARMMDERVQSWLNGMRRDAPLTTRFTRAEYDQLVARRSDIRKARSGS